VLIGTDVILFGPITCQRYNRMLNLSMDSSCSNSMYIASKLKSAACQRILLHRPLFPLWPSLWYCNLRFSKNNPAFSKNYGEHFICLLLWTSSMLQVLTKLWNIWMLFSSKMWACMHKHLCAHGCPQVLPSVLTEHPEPDFSCDKRNQLRSTQLAQHISRARLQS